MPRVFDCFPFFNELDVLEVRLHELADVVDRFLIVEALETYGGTQRETVLDKVPPGYFGEVGSRCIVRSLIGLEPECTDRTSGRLREKFQRDELLPLIRQFSPQPDDVVMISDCDEVPRAQAVREAIPRLKDGIHRFKQRSFYYNVNTQVDYGHDFASRARIGTFAQLEAVGSVYGFRMAPALEVENGGWHFGYFGGTERIKQKVSALAPFLDEYKLFDDQQLERDITERRDLHHRRCEMPEVFAQVGDDDLPEYLLANRAEFAHFFAETVNA